MKEGNFSIIPLNFRVTLIVMIVCGLEKRGLKEMYNIVENILRNKKMPGNTIKEWDAMCKKLKKEDGGRLLRQSVWWKKSTSSILDVTVYNCMEKRVIQRRNIT